MVGNILISWFTCGGCVKDEGLLGVSEHVEIRGEGADDGEGVLPPVLGVEHVDGGPELVEVGVGGVEPEGGHSDVLQQQRGPLQCHQHDRYYYHDGPD